MPEFTSADPNAYVAIGIQSALGTIQSTPAKFRFAKYIAGNDFGVMPAVVDVREGGDGLDYGVSYKSGHDVSGQVVCYPRPELLGQILAFLPGGATWGGASAPALHTYHGNHASFPYATLQIQHPGSDMVHLLSDVRFTGLTWELRSGQPHKMTLPFQARDSGASSGIALVPSSLSEEFFLYHHNPSYVVDGAADSTIEAITIRMNLGVEALQAQSVKKDAFVVQNRDMDVELVSRYQDSTRWRKIAYSGGVTPSTSVATGALRVFNFYDAGATLKELTINLGLLSYRENKLAELNPDGVTVKETIRAKALKCGTSAIHVQLKNIHASAYGS